MPTPAPPAPPAFPATRPAGTPAPVKGAGLVIGLALFGALSALDPPAGMAEAGWRVAAVAVLMAVWWMTEAVPVAATALLPLTLFQPLGVTSMEAAAAPYANPLIFLFMGGFMIALTVERWGLHRRLALMVLARVGTRPDALVGGFMAAAALLSMWVSNTATTVMMLPIALSVITVVAPEGRSPHGEAGRLPCALLIGTAYGASIGGIATLVGTPPNALLAGFMAESYGIAIGFAQWMAIGLPLSLAMLIAAWLVLTRLAFRVGSASITGAETILAAEAAALGPPSRGEAMVAVVFVATALAWVLRPLLADAFPGLAPSDTGIAIAAAIVLFILPVDLGRGVFVLDWEWARRLPWHVLLLFGGGLSLASAIAESGLADWIGDGLAGLAAWPTLAVVVAVTALIVFLTELTSNTATTAAFLPVAAVLSATLGENPLLFVVPTAIAASCAFMMPVATPPNAIVFASGHVTIPQMARAGVLLNLVAIALITAVAYALLGLAFGVEIGVAPPWASG